MKTHLTIYPDTRRPKASGKYPVKLRITFLGEQKYYPIGIDLSQDEFKLVNNPGAIDKKMELKAKRQIKDWKLKCDALWFKADIVIKKMEGFTFRLFEKRFYMNEQSALDVYQFYDATIKRLKDGGKVGTAYNYSCSMNSLKKFSSKLSFREVTVDFLKEYESMLTSNGRSISTVGIYLRPLRAIINEAIAEGLISKESHYHFGKRKYQIPSPKNIKKALTLDEIKKIYNYKGPDGSWMQKSRDFFIFSYLGNGINVKDIALLKFKNIEGDFIKFNRAKTLDTNRNGRRAISIHVSYDIKSIILRWRNNDPDPEGFIFPILHSKPSPEEERKVVQQFIKTLNKYLNLVAGEVGINKHITSYFARHSFATVLKRGGASIEIISEALGHSNHKTTLSYLDSFEDDTKRDMQVKLLSFKSDESSPDGA
jgi:integrase/recombinase XerD